MLSCALCESVITLTSSHCERCRKIKNIGNTYGFNEILEVLEIVCLRNGEQRARKMNYLKKKAEKEAKETVEGKVYGDDSKDYDKNKN